MSNCCLSLGSASSGFDWEGFGGNSQWKVENNVSAICSDGISVVTKHKFCVLCVQELCTLNVYQWLQIIIYMQLTVFTWPLHWNRTKENLPSDRRKQYRKTNKTQLWSHGMFQKPGICVSLYKKMKYFLFNLWILHFLFALLPDFWLLQFLCLILEISGYI